MNKTMIFLSASIPIKGREYYGTANIPAIREAVMAFTKVCMDFKLPFYFGGHPAISPLVYQIAKEYGAVFVYQIGWPLKDGKSHDGRAADYDDWTLNGDILLWYDVLGIALEISSMGIRVDEESLVKQLAYKKEEFKLENPYCQSILNKELPLTIGGGIGQSRLCMFFLQKRHIGEVQASAWPQAMLDSLAKENIYLL